MTDCRSAPPTDSAIRPEEEGRPQPSGDQGEPEREEEEPLSVGRLVEELVRSRYPSHALLNPCPAAVLRRLDVAGTIRRRLSSASSPGRPGAALLQVGAVT